MKKLLSAISLAALLFVSFAAHASQNALVAGGFPTVSPYPGLTLVQNINSAFQADQSNNSGPSAPGYAGAYSTWINTTSNPYPFNVYDGASWLSMGTIDGTNHLWNITGANITTSYAGSSQANFSSTGSNIATVSINNSAGAQGSALQFENAGAQKWNEGIDTSNAFFLTDAVGSREFLNAATGGGMNVAGSPLGDNAPAGYFGEYIQSNVLISSGVSLTSGTAANITSISLSAGDWDVAGSVIIGPNGAGTLSAFNGAISTVSGTAPVGATGNAQAFLGGIAITGAAQQLISFGPTRISVSTTTPVFLIAGANFSGGTCVAAGNIRARRVR